MSDAFPVFEYFHFAKTRMVGSRFPLCLSGVTEVGIADVAPRGEEAARIEGSALGPALELWRERICDRYGVPAGHAFPAVGTSGAVYLALAALHSLLPRGAAVAMERPAYAVFECGARMLGREMVHVERRAEDRYAVDLAAVEHAFRTGARVYCLTDLHNPTGVALSDAELTGLRELAARFDAWILLDEVYRDFRDGPASTGYRPGERVVCAASLTKCYGLGGIRAGWVFAPPGIVERMDLVEEVLYGMPPAGAILLAAQGFARADALLERGRAATAAGRALMDAWMAATPGVSWVPPAGGITGLVQVDGVTDSMQFAQRLREELDVQVVPGAFFGTEGSIRVSFGLEPKAVAAALDVLTLGLGALRA